MMLRILAVALLATLLAAPAATAATDAAVETDARDCGGRIDWGCGHYGSPTGLCLLYLDLQGTGDGACVLY